MKREKRRKTQHRMKNIALAKNNKLNKLYVSADVAGAHINPVETHENYMEGAREKTARNLPRLFPLHKFLRNIRRLSCRYDCRLHISKLMFRHSFFLVLSLLCTNNTLGKQNESFIRP